LADHGRAYQDREIVEEVANILRELQGTLVDEVARLRMGEALVDVAHYLRLRLHRE
jgi:hypothetical protein